MKIRKSLFTELEGWSIHVKDDEGQTVTYISIPPESGDRTDVFLETRKENCFYHKYLFDFKDNIKKLKGEKMIIIIKNGNVELKYMET